MRDPLLEMLGQYRSAAELQRLDAMHEERISQCMAAVGFTYLPVRRPVSSFPDVVDTASSYGIVERYRTYELPAMMGSSTILVEPDNPNDSYVDAMSSTDRGRYMAELNGDSRGDHLGCIKSATYELNPMSKPEISVRMFQLLNARQSAPQVESIQRRWSACMGKEGFKLQQPQDALTLVLQRKAELSGLTVSAYTAGQLIENPADPTGPKQAAATTGFTTSGKPQPIPEADVNRLFDLERTVFRVDRRCQEQSGFLEIQRRTSDEIVRTLKAEFPELG